MKQVQYLAAQFDPVVRFPGPYRVYDFTQGPPADSQPGEWGVGRYNERRARMYVSPLFEGVRDIHMGIDLSGPAGTEIHAFFEGEVHSFRLNPSPGDYGPTLITRHLIDGTELFALHGHLSRPSIEGKRVGQKISKGETIAWIGTEEENGGWPPHLHFQLSWEPPAVCDMPGVVGAEQLEEALRRYPDPRMVLGPLY